MMDKRRTTMLKAIMPYLCAVFIGLSSAFTIILAFHPAIVNGLSMMPTYKNGQILRSEPSFARDDIKKGSIVLIKKPYKTMIKRVIASPGETIQIKEGFVYINGHIDHSFDFDKINDPGLATEPISLRKDQYFVLGDNRNYSNDSRNMGPVLYEEIAAIITD